MKKEQVDPEVEAGSWLRSMGLLISYTSERVIDEYIKRQNV